MNNKIYCLLCFSLLLCCQYVSFADDCPPSVEELYAFFNIGRFTEDNLKSISGTADAITRLTNESDILVFLGRSPLYIAESLESKGARRQVHRIAFSDAVIAPTRSQLLSYRRYLESNGITPERIAKAAPNRVYLVDYALSGRTIVAFANILKDWAEETGYNANSVVRNLQPIVLIYDNELVRIGKALKSNTGNPIELPVVSIAMDSATLNKLVAFFDDVTLGAYYPARLWSLGPPEENLGGTGKKASPAGKGV